MICRYRLLPAVALLFLTVSATIGAQTTATPRTPSGHPDLSGTYDIATLTPLQRPERFGEKAFLTEEEAAALEREEFDRNLDRNQASNPNREAPQEGVTVLEVQLVTSEGITVSGSTSEHQPCS